MFENSEHISLKCSSAAFEALTSHYRGMCCEAAAFCLSESGHSSPTPVSVTGSCLRESHLDWRPPPTEAAATFGDRDVAAENGAYAVAIALLHHTHAYRALARAAKGDGFDFWVGRESDDVEFGRATRLEVSGIFNGSRRVNTRLKEKIMQVNRRNHHARCIAVVAEFGQPSVAVHEGN